MAQGPRQTTDVMDCAELERSVDAYLDRELEDADRAEADAHLAACADCRRRLDAQERVHHALRARLRAALGPGSPAGRAPEGLRERVQAALARERKPLWRRALAPVPIATLAACAAGALVVLVTHGGNDPLIDEAVRKHTRDLPLEVTAASVGTESVPAWFAGKLDFNPAPPRFRNGAVKLVGARLSNIKDKPAAYMRYELPRGHLGLFIVDDPERRFGDSGHAVQIGPSTVRMINARGYNVAVWRRNEIVYSLVSDLDEQDLARLVETAAAASDR